MKLIKNKYHKKNNEIRKLLGLSYFMQPEERLTYTLLLHYSYVLHEDVTKVSDEEIQKARDFSKLYLDNHRILPNDIDSELQSFVNKQVLKAITGMNFDDIKNEMAKKIYDDLSISNCIGNLKKASLDYYFDTNNYDSIIIKVSNNNKSTFYIYDANINMLSRTKYNDYLLNKKDILEKTVFNKKLLNSINSNNIKIEFTPIEIGIDDYSIGI